MDKNKFEKLIEIAKNLLEDKTCDSCWRRIYLPKSKCALPKEDMSQEGIAYRTIAKENTCENWKFDG